MILFLDFDGVLHPSSVYIENGRPVLKGAAELFMWAPILSNTLEPYPNVKIVLSTNWVRRKGFSWAKKSLPAYLQRRVIGATWHSRMLICKENCFKSISCWYDEASRFQQIQKYVARENTGNWIALDDLHDQTERWNREFQNHLILTNSAKGLSESEVVEKLKSQLVALLNQDRQISQN